MNRAFFGLRTAARALGGGVAEGAMNIAELAASMSDEERGLMLAELGVKSGASDDAGGQPAANAEGGAEQGGAAAQAAAAEPVAPSAAASATEAQLAAARADGRAEGAAEARAAERTRCQTVVASENFAGREALAAELLGSDMSAERIIASMAAAPKSDSNAMLGNLQQQRNPDLGTGAENQSQQQQAADSWARTFANLGWDKNAG